jgi:hypothetical protein
MSAILCYLKDLPVSTAYVDVLAKMNLTWGTMNFAVLSDEQTTDFFQNYFGFVATLFKNPVYRQQYAVCSFFTIQ